MSSARALNATQAQVQAMVDHSVSNGLKQAAQITQEQVTRSALIEQINSWLCGLLIEACHNVIVCLFRTARRLHSAEVCVGEQTRKAASCGAGGRQLGGHNKCILRDWYLNATYKQAFLNSRQLVRNPLLA